METEVEAEVSKASLQGRAARRSTGSRTAHPAIPDCLLTASRLQGAISQRVAYVAYVYEKTAGFALVVLVVTTGPIGEEGKCSSGLHTRHHMHELMERCHACTAASQQTPVRK